MTEVQALERALAAIDTGDLEVALGELLAAWRACRDERIAAAIDEVSARVSATRARPGGDRVNAKQAAWLALANVDDPADLGALLATLTEIRKAEPLLERIEKLASRPADPRIAAAFMKLVDHPPIPGATGIEPLSRALAVIVELGDPRQLRELERIVASHDGLGGGSSRWYIGKHGEGLVERVRAGVALAHRDADPAAFVVLDAVRSRLADARPPREVRGGGDELFAAVYAHPELDEPRAVLADYLQECGDPRGEFIALQLARARGDKRTKREGELLRASGRDWLGAIEPLVLKTKLAFERGFIARCAVKGDSYDIVAELVKRPEWATVTDVDVSAVGSHASEFAARMPALRALRGIARLPSAHPTLEEAELVRLDDEHLDELVANDGLPKLRRLVVESVWRSVATLEPLWSSPIGRRLESFAADVSADLEAWIGRALELPIADIAITRRNHEPWGFHITGSALCFEFLWAFAKPKADDFDRLYPIIQRLPDSSRIRSATIESSGVAPPESIVQALARFNP